MHALEVQSMIFLFFEAVLIFLYSSSASVYFLFTIPYKAKQTYAYRLIREKNLNCLTLLAVDEKNLNIPHDYLALKTH